MKKTLVLGASEKPDRYSNRAVKSLLKAGFEVVAVGNKEGSIDNVPIQKGTPNIEGVHTVTLYLSAANQKSLYEYIFGLKPQRIIFNPGAENMELFEKAQQKNIEALEACTLVMLSLGNF